MSLMRHALAHGGNTKEFRRRLADIYDQFSEGTLTPDLIEAKSLLDGPTRSRTDARPG
jgi:hypothetical protein